MSNGWDNYMFRVGDKHVARLPRRKVAVELIEHERDHLPGLAKGLPIPVPTFSHIGTAGDGYPWPWLVVPWFEGDNPDHAPLSTAAALQLADFLKALHKPDGGKAPTNQYRGVPLRRRDEAVRHYWDTLARHGEPIDTRLVRMWEGAVLLPDFTGSCWLHGDMHYANILVTDGMISAICDWGDICGGDPATDLAAFWMLFEDAEARVAGFARYGVNEETILRAKGWALSFGSVLLSSGYASNARQASAGRATLQRLLSDL